MKNKEERERWTRFADKLVELRIFPNPFHICTVDVAKTGYCKVHLDDDDVEQFTMAVDRHYWFELFMDDLPIWGFVGEVRRKEENGKCSECSFSGDILFVCLLSSSKSHISLSLLNFFDCRFPKKTYFF